MTGRNGRIGGTGRIACGVSGAGSNLRALVAAADRGELAGEFVLVFADRACPALDWAAEHGITATLVGEVVEADAIGGDRYQEAVLGAFPR